MTAPITRRQKDLLQIIYKYIKDTGYPPAIQEMRQSLEVASNQSVIDLLNHLETKKYITRKESIARSLAILPYGYQLLNEEPLVPFLGITHAGAPIDTVQIDGEWQVVSSDTALLKDKTFLLKVIGDSMINAGINEGDIVLVMERKEFISGDIVLAQINSESTIKRFISQRKPPYLYLKPENPKYEIVLFTHEVQMTGKVVSVLKQGQWTQPN